MSNNSEQNPDQKVINARSEYLAALQASSEELTPETIRELDDKYGDYVRARTTPLPNDLLSLFTRVVQTLGD